MTLGACLGRTSGVRSRRQWPTGLTRLRGSFSRHSRRLRRSSHSSSTGALRRCEAKHHSAATMGLGKERPVSNRLSTMHSDTGDPAITWFTTLSPTAATGSSLPHSCAARTSVLHPSDHIWVLGVLLAAPPATNRTGCPAQSHVDDRPSRPRMTLPGRGAPRGTGAGRTAARRGRGPSKQLHALPASRLASVELQQEVAEQLLELGGFLWVFG